MNSQLPVTYGSHQVHEEVSLVLDNGKELAFRNSDGHKSKIRAGHLEAVVLLEQKQKTTAVLVNQNIWQFRKISSKRKNLADLVTPLTDLELP